MPDESLKDVRLRECMPRLFAVILHKSSPLNNTIKDVLLPIVYWIDNAKFILEIITQHTSNTIANAIAII